MSRKKIFLSRMIAIGMAILLVGALVADVQAQDSGVSVVRVEEDWELYVGQADANSAGPQVSCTFSPTNHVSGIHAVFEINHQSLPSFVPGGLQLQIWEGEAPSVSRKLPGSAVMSTTDECVKWTQLMRLDGNTLTFKIKNGSSTTWGGFDGTYLRHEATSDLTNLNDYSPEVSVANSGAGFAGNRVKLLLLREVRYYLSNGQVVVDNTARIAHPTE